MSHDGREEALKIHADVMRIVTEIGRLIEEQAELSRQLSPNNTGAQDAEIMAKYRLRSKRLLELTARHRELMRTIFDLLGIPEN